MTTLTLGTSWFNDPNQSISSSAQAHQDLSVLKLIIECQVATPGVPAKSQSELESVFQLDLATFLLACGLVKEHRDAISEGRALGTLGVLKPNRDLWHITKGLCCYAVAEQGLCSCLGILITSWSCFKSLSAQMDPACLVFNQPAFNWCFFPGSKQAGAHSVRLCPACVSLHVYGRKGLQSTLLKKWNCKSKAPLILQGCWQWLCLGHTWTWEVSTGCWGQAGGLQIPAPRGDV